MINVTRKKCATSKCDELGSFGFPGLPRGSRCEAHSLPGMVAAPLPNQRKSIKTKNTAQAAKPKEEIYYCRIEGCGRQAPYWDPYVDYAHLCEEHALITDDGRCPRLQLLTPPVLFTATVSYKTNFRGDYAVIAEIPLTEKILAIKSVATPLEKCMDNPYMGADRIIKKQNLRNEAVMVGDKSRKQKKTPGNGLYFQACDEFVVVRTGNEGSNPYKIRVFPSTGTSQITGVQMPLVSGDKELRFVLDTISDYLGAPPIEVQERSVNMLNFKLTVKAPPMGDPALWVVHLYRLTTLFHGYLTGTPMEIIPPHPVVSVTTPSEACSFVYVDFGTPIEKKLSRKTRVKVYTKRKISVFAAPTFEIASEIVRYMDSILYLHRDSLLVDISYRTAPSEPLDAKNEALVQMF